MNRESENSLAFDFLTGNLGSCRDDHPLFLAETNQSKANYWFYSCITKQTGKPSRESKLILLPCVGIEPAMS